MTPQLDLNFDIWDIIVDILEDESDHKGLQTLSLTCKSMAPLCRKRLFSHLVLNGRSKLCHRYKNLIAENDKIIVYVRHLQYSLYDSSDPDAHFILNTLKDRSVALESIRIWHEGKNWDTYPLSLQILLDQLIHLPSVTRIDLSHIEGIPTTILVGCTPITNLFLEEVEFIVPAIPVMVHGPIGRNPRPVYLKAHENSYNALRTLLERRGANKDKMIVDFSGLKAVLFQVTRIPGDMQVIQNILQITDSLESLEYMTYEHHPQWTGLGAALTITGTVSKLKKLILHRFISLEDQDPLDGLNQELKILAGVNRLEEIELSVAFSTGISCRPGTEDWASFDALMTHEKSFPSLRAVSVNIWWYSLGPAENYVGTIREDHFPKLVNSKAVKFNFSVEHDYV